MMDLIDEFFETRQERHIARVACFFEQKPSNIGAIYKGSRVEVGRLVSIPDRADQK